MTLKSIHVSEDTRGYLFVVAIDSLGDGYQYVLCVCVCVLLKHHCYTIVYIVYKFSICLYLFGVSYLLLNIRFITTTDDHHGYWSKIPLPDQSGAKFVSLETSTQNGYNCIWCLLNNGKVYGGYF